MTYTLHIGDPAYSSWSLRGWLLLDAFGIKSEVTLVPMYSDSFTQMQANHAPARTVPSLKVHEGGFIIWESLAIAETLHENHPDKALWPAEPQARGAARALAAEMHAGFLALRRACPMNLRVRYRGFEPDEAVAGDIARLETLWAWALDKFGGPYLTGKAFSVADAMFAPVATRLVSYGIEVQEPTRQYIAAIYAHPSFRRWHAMADADPRILDVYDQPYQQIENVGWPRPHRMGARIYNGAVSDAANTHCPFSGKPVSTESLADIEGTIIGFCNPTCRDKVVADAGAWPQVTALL